MKIHPNWNAEERALAEAYDSESVTEATEPDLAALPHDVLQRGLDNGLGASLVPPTAVATAPAASKAKGGDGRAGRRRYAPDAHPRLRVSDRAEIETWPISGGQYSERNST